MATLKAFPIFKLATSATAPEGSAQRAEPAFTDLCGEGPCRLAPPETDPALLGPQFLAEPLPGEAEVLRQRLGVQQMTQGSFVTEQVFSRYVLDRHAHAPRRCMQPPFYVVYQHGSAKEHPRVQLCPARRGNSHGEATGP